MKYTLSAFDNLLNNNDKHAILEVAQIMEEIKQAAFLLSTQEQTRLYVQNHQTSLLAYKRHGPIADQCDELLYFLECQFSTYLDDTLPVSQRGKELYEMEFEDLIKYTRLELQEELPPRLFKYLEPLFDLSGTRTIYQLRYIRSFWEKWPFHKGSRLYEEKVILYLITQNYNHPKLFRYITGGIVGALHAEDDYMIIEEVLISYAHKLSNILTKVGHPYFCEYPHMKLQLDEWIKLQIKQCNRRHKLANPDQQNLFSQQEAKIQMSISVAEMACLFKLFQQAGIINNAVHMEILHIISAHFSTKKVAQISLGSLHNKYYHVEMRTTESLRRIIQHLDRELDKMI